MHTKFIQITDTHITAEQKPLLGLNPLERLRIAIDHIERNHADVAFVLVTGDLADSGEISAYQDMAAQYKRLSMPVHLAIGNHDDRSNFQRVFHRLSGTHSDNHFIQSMFDVAGVSHIIVDTVQTGSSHGHLCRARLDWLRSALESSSPNSCILYMHHPPYDSGIHEMDGCRLENPQDLAAVIAPHSKRILQIFHGHLHRDIHTVFAGIPTCGSRSTVHTIALQLDETAPLAISDEPPGYTVVLFDQQSVIVHRQNFLQGSQLSPL